MPQVKFDRIISCSSEDPAYPSKNLLLGRDFNRKWKSKEPGEESVSVIIQLTQPYVITGVDIGNDGSSFVEVLASKTSKPDDFQVLLVMSSFMTPMDARSETNKNRVRMFSLENLSDPVRKEKWDRIKVVCTQPFNKHLKYGLSFLVLHSNEQKPEVSQKPTSPAKKTLGRFALKDDDNDPEISVGSFFSRRKDLEASPPPSPASLTGAAAVRDAASPANLAEYKAGKNRKGSNDLNDSLKKKRGRPKISPLPMTDTSESPSGKETKPRKNGNSSKVDDKPKITSPEKLNDSRRNPNPSPDRSKVTESKRKTKPSSDDDTGPSSATPGSSKRNQSKQKPTSGSKENITYKPFNKLFEGLGIVISGYENPGRSEIREKALAMGAKYSNKWEASSTHLICAFINTPKFLEVQGRGLIVTRDWIDDCYRERKKLSWRKYATDVNERKDANNTTEPEVWELIPGMNLNADSPLPPVSRRNNLATRDTRIGSDSEDSEDEIERIRAKQNLKRKKIEMEDDREKNDFVAKKKIDGRSVENEAYNGSTDIDSEEEANNRLREWSEKQSKATRDNLPPLPDFFKDKTFYLSLDLPESERHTLSRYITAFGGEILKSQEQSVNFIVSSKKCQLSEGSRSVCVTPEWIWECNDRQRLISPILFEP